MYACTRSRICYKTIIKITYATSRERQQRYRPGRKALQEEARSPTTESIRVLPEARLQREWFGAWILQIYERGDRSAKMVSRYINRKVSALDLEIKAKNKKAFKAVAMWAFNRNSERRKRKLIRQQYHEKRISTFGGRLSYLRAQAAKETWHPISYQQRRKDFDAIKHIYHKQYRICWLCQNSPVEHIHHKIMLSKGGENTRQNLIGLCEPCHCQVHDWMVPKQLNDQISKEFQQISLTEFYPVLS